MTEYETVIGLEVHSQLLTKSKMFCACSAAYASTPPNTFVCPVCLGLPGALPVMNARAIEFTALTGLALGCTIAQTSRFDRKNYMYPDLMKNYQISQYDQPIAEKGTLEVDVDGLRTTVGITRVHLEEDTARLSHRTDPDGAAYSLVDANRSGVPLMEIVSEPDIRSPEEARAYLVKLRTILQYIGASTGSMEEGSFRCDANISLRPIGREALGSKVEIKNMNSFRAVLRALQYEVERQRKLLIEGVTIPQETRGWDDERGITVSQRSKEFAHDYRYFPDPDLPPLELSREWIEEIGSRLPELPEARRDRFTVEYSLSEYDSAVLTTTRSLADFFERSVELVRTTSKNKDGAPKAVSNWMLNDLLGLLNSTAIELEDSKVTPESLTELISLVDSTAISMRTAKEIFPTVFETGKSPKAIVTERGLAQVSDESELIAFVDAVIDQNPKSAIDFRAGKKAALGRLVGEAMKLSRGKANPGLVNRLLSERLSQPERSGTDA